MILQSVGTLEQISSITGLSVEEIIKQALDSPLQRIDTDYLSSVQMVKTHYVQGLDSSVSWLERNYLTTIRHCQGTLRLKP